MLTTKSLLTLEKDFLSEKSKDGHADRKSVGQLAVNHILGSEANEHSRSEATPKQLLLF